MTYALGHSDDELERLTFQASVLAPVTRRLLVDAGLRRGMTVLDLGCGPGDVSMLASSVVGDDGYVLGIDLDLNSVHLAKKRWQKLGGAKNVEFKHGRVETFTSRQLFDFVIGRYVLIHQVDCAAFLRKAAHFVQPGGVIAFHELVIEKPFTSSSPVVDSWQRQTDQIFDFLTRKLPNPFLATNFVNHFAAAGLPFPHLTYERFVGAGHDSPLYRWAAEMANHISAESVDIKALENTIRRDAVMSCSQLIGPGQVCAWARLSSADSQ